MRLVELLAVAAAQRRLHEQRLGGHERQLAGDPRRDHAARARAARRRCGRRAPRMASLARKASGRTSRRLAESSRLRSSHCVAALSGPLSGVGHDPARQAAHALGAHRVALVGHRRRADLVLVERLGELAHALQQAQVGAHLVAALGDAGRASRAAGCRACGCRSGRRPAIDAGEAEPGGDPAVELAHLRVVAGEQREEARLRAGRPLDAAAAQPVASRCSISARSSDEVLRPEAGALADRRELRRLEVGVGEAGQGAVAPGEVGEAARAPSRAGAASSSSASRIRSRSVLSVTKALVAPRWRMPPAPVRSRPPAPRSAGGARRRRGGSGARARRPGRGRAAAPPRSRAAICSARIGRPSSRLRFGEQDPDPAPGREAVASSRRSPPSRARRSARRAGSGAASGRSSRGAFGAGRHRAEDNKARAPGAGLRSSREVIPTVAPSALGRTGPGRDAAARRGRGAHRARHRERDRAARLLGVAPPRRHPQGAGGWVRPRPDVAPTASRSTASPVKRALLQPGRPDQGRHLRARGRGGRASRDGGSRARDRGMPTAGARAWRRSPSARRPSCARSPTSAPPTGSTARPRARRGRQAQGPRRRPTRARSSAS